jgi:hypothetical protein
MAKFIKQDAGVLTEEATVTTSAGVGDAGKVPNLDSAGKIDNSMLPITIGKETVDLVASEALAAGDFVNIWNDAGTPKVRKADASAIATEAMGFVLAAYSALDTATVYLEGTNDQLSGLTPGATYYLSETAGLITLTAPSTTGAVVQRVGRAHSATKLSAELSNPIVLA